MMLLAHAGHWLVNLAFAAPAVAFIGWLGWVTVKDRMGRRKPEADPPPPD